MTPQERDLIATLLTRLQGAASQPKDPEAEALIRQAMTAQPDAPYYLVQTVLIQDLSLHNAQNRIAQLEQQLGEAKAAQPPATSFLGGLFGHSQSAPPAPTAGAPSVGPWGRAPQVAAAPPQGYSQPGYAQSGYSQPPGGSMGGGMAGGMGSGGGFLRSAAATAAGVAGGALLFEGIQSLFGHHYSNSLMGGAMMPGVGETVINNYYGDAAAGQDYGAGQDFGGGQDFGSGQDYGAGQDFGTGSDFDTSGDSGGSDFGGGDFGGGDFGGGDDNAC